MAQTLASIFGKGEQSTGSGTSSNTGTNRSNMAGTSNSSTTAPPPIASMAAFLPPGQQAVGAVDPGLNLVAGGLGATGDLFGAWAQAKAKQDYLNALNGGGSMPTMSADPFGSTGQFGGGGFQSPSLGFPR